MQMLIRFGHRLQEHGHYETTFNGYRGYALTDRVVEHAASQALFELESDIKDLWLSLDSTKYFFAVYSVLLAVTLGAFVSQAIYSTMKKFKNREMAGIQVGKSHIYAW